MLAVMSPARNIRPAELPGLDLHRPLFLDEANEIAAVVRTYSPWQLESLLGLSAERAMVLYDHYQMFAPDLPGTHALPSLYGQAFRTMELGDFDLDDYRFADRHIMVLSALYGAIRPADGILPYRIGFGSDLTVDGKDLYTYWGDKIYRAVFGRGEPVIGIASNDYLKTLIPYMQPGDTLINCRFLIQRPDGARGTVATVRTARGLMARFIVKNRIDRPEGLVDFDLGGYQFDPLRSTEGQFVFVRSY